MFFFFKHEAAYDVGICDWSSDVCSSGLGVAARGRTCSDGSVRRSSGSYSGASGSDSSGLLASKLGGSAWMSLPWRVSVIVSSTPAQEVWVRSPVVRMLSSERSTYVTDATARRRKIHARGGREDRQ